MNNDVVEIKKDIFFTGVYDFDLRVFDIIMKAPSGTSYNSYLVKGSSGVAIIDTAKEEFADEFFANIESLVKYDEIKYIIINHLEPDHSGSLPELIKRAPQAKIVISSKAKAMLKAFMKQPLEFDTVKTGDTISLGNKTLEFLITPFLHWPDTMMTYIQEDEILFSCDAFGSHYHDKRLFNDKVGDFGYAFQYYYDHIMRPFKSYVHSALELLKNYKLDVIAPSHGPILVDKPEQYVALYEQWSQPKEIHPSGKILINLFYASSYGNTREMGNFILRGMNSVEGIIASRYDLEALDFERGVHLLERSDAIVVGSPTINGDAVKPVWDLLAGFAYIESKGKIGAAFGSFGWGGEAVGMLQDRMKSLRIKVPIEPIRIKLIPTEEELQQCFDFGVEFANAVLSKLA